MPANARHAGAEALEHIAVTLRFKRRTCWFELVGQELDMRIIFLQPRVVELTVDRRDARVTLFASQHAVAEHQYLGLPDRRSEEHPSELQSLMRISYDVFFLKKKNNTYTSQIK